MKVPTSDELTHLAQIIAQRIDHFLAACRCGDKSGTAQEAGTALPQHQRRGAKITLGTFVMIYFPASLIVSLWSSSPVADALLVIGMVFLIAVFPLLLAGAVVGPLIQYALLRPDSLIHARAGCAPGRSEPYEQIVRGTGAVPMPEWTQDLPRVSHPPVPVSGTGAPVHRRS